MGEAVLLETLDRIVGDDAGLRAAEALAEEHDPDPAHAVQVCRNAVAILDQMRADGDFDKRARRLLAAAALLHDIGWSMPAAPHHKASRDLILKSGLPGFSEEELRAIACIARYHRKALPKSKHKVYGELPSAVQQQVRQLAGILRIADGLDRSHCSATQALCIERLGNRRRIYVVQRSPGPTDIWGAMRKRGLFEQVFGVQVEVVAENAALPGSSS